VEFSVPFQHKYGYIRDKSSRVESYPYPVKEGQRYINLNPGRLFVQQPPKKGKGSRGSLNYYVSAYNRERQLSHCKTKTKLNLKYYKKHASVTKNTYNIKSIQCLLQRLIANYTAWWQQHKRVKNLPTTHDLFHNPEFPLHYTLALFRDPKLFFQRNVSVTILRVILRERKTEAINKQTVQKNKRKWEQNA